MKKIHVTRKYLKENYICCGIGYCDASYLLYYYSASFYNLGFMAGILMLLFSVIML